MKMKLICAVLLFAILFTTACRANKITLDPALTASLNASADSYDAQFPDDEAWNIARLCVTEPLGLYRHEAGQIWAVVCVIRAFPDTYGAVLLDNSYTVLSAEHVSAKDLAALEALVFSVGWKK
jgi:hypothetical protein